MRAIHWILRNNSDITSLLQAPTTAGAVAADAVYIGHAIQDQEPAYITIDADTIDNYIDKDGGRGFIKEAYDVYIYDRSYANVKAIAEKVEAALDGVASGQYNGQTLHSCRLVNESSLNTIEENVHYWMIVQTYEATLNAPTASTVGTSVPTIKLTQAEYDGISPDSTTYYLIQE